MEGKDISEGLSKVGQAISNGWQAVEETVEEIVEDVQDAAESVDSPQEIAASLQAQYNELVDDYNVQQELIAELEAKLNAVTEFYNVITQYRDSIGVLHHDFESYTAYLERSRGLFFTYLLESLSGGGDPSHLYTLGSAHIAELTDLIDQVEADKRALTREKNAAECALINILDDVTYIAAVASGAGINLTIRILL